jgi:hypothetical protein
LIQFFVLYKMVYGDKFQIVAIGVYKTHKYKNIYKKHTKRSFLISFKWNFLANDHLHKMTTTIEKFFVICSTKWCKFEGKKYSPKYRIFDDYFWACCYFTRISMLFWDRCNNLFKLFQFVYENGHQLFIE